MASRRKISWNEFLMDSDGEFSFKRIFTGFFAILFVFLFIMNMFTGRMVNERLLDTIEVVILSSLGLVGLEMFAKRRTTTIVSPKGTVIQEANPLTSGGTKVSETVEKMIENTAGAEEEPKLKE
jgi:hypothetical protein